MARSCRVSLSAARLALATVLLVSGCGAPGEGRAATEAATGAATGFAATGPTTAEGSAAERAATERSTTTPAAAAGENRMAARAAGDRAGGGARDRASDGACNGANDQASNGAKDRAGDEHQRRPSLVGPHAARWWQVLTRLDRWRSKAFVRARPGLLDQVYAHGSRSGRRDRAILLDYHRRGVGLERVRLEVSVLRVVGRARGAVTLRVVERLRPTHAVLPSGVRTSLPRDAATRRLLHLVRTPRGWRIAGVRRIAG